jgi:hypothetical protein
MDQQTQIQNPIASRNRGWIYVSGIALGGVLTVVGVALSTVGLGEWSGVVVAALGAITTATNSLARANLSNPFGGGEDA